MSELAEKLAQQALGLPVEDRAEIVRLLIASLDQFGDPAVEAAWAAELRQRVERVEQEKAHLWRAQEVLEEIKDKHKSVQCS